MLKQILFTHDDMDGIGCKILFMLAQYATGNCLGTDYAVEVCSNSKVVDERVKARIEDGSIGSETNIFITDVCPSTEVTIYLYNMLEAKKIGKFMIYDHHDTNLGLLQIVPWVVIKERNDTGFECLESGTSLFYNGIKKILFKGHFDIDFIQHFVNCVRSYDTYEWKETGNIMAKKLNVLFGLIGAENFCEKYFYRITNSMDLDSLITPDDMIFVDCKYEYEQSVIDRFSIDDVIALNLRGYNIAFLAKSVPANISELAHQFLNKYPQFDAFASFSLFNGGEFSFRTIRDDLHVGEVFAKPIGGGGHPKASGAPLPDEYKNVLKMLLINRLNGNNVSANTTVQLSFSTNKEA